MRRQDSPPRTIRVEIDGKTHIGRYRVSGRVITVTAAGGQRSNQLGAAPPEVMAAEMLRALIRER